MRAEAEAINRHIGDRLRVLRKKRGLSQGDLGAVLDVSFQQMGNYEKGKDRLSAGALFMVFQDPLGSLNPLHTVGTQLRDAVLGRRTAMAAPR